MIQKWERMIEIAMAVSGRTRTCNQTVMSGQLKIAFVDFPAFSSECDRVCWRSMRSFLVRNWCGPVRPRTHQPLDGARHCAAHRLIARNSPREKWTPIVGEFWLTRLVLRTTGSV